MNCITILFIIIFGLSVNTQAETPQISPILPQETREGIALSVPITVTADSEIVSVRLESSNKTLIPDEHLLYDCNAGHYTIVATPNYKHTGASTISIAVTDFENNTTSTHFRLTVTPFDDSLFYWKNYQTAVTGIENVFHFPSSVAVDPTSGKIFVSDTGNNRVLRFSQENLTVSEAVFGDAASYTMGEPMGLHVDPFGRLWVADMNNHRVLRFDHASSMPDSAPPDGILGKASHSDYSKTSQDAMKLPTDVWFDPTGTLWVADSENHRILRFDNAAQKENFADADAVLGQPDFTSMSMGVSQSKLHSPRSIVVYQRHLFVADRLNNRVLCYKDAASKSFLANADFVLGQPDFVTKEKQLSATGMDLPSGLAIDSQGRLFVAEQNNNRVLIFENVVNKSNGDAANNLLGQENFLSNRIDDSYRSLFSPYILTYNPINHHLWVPDLIHNRVLRFDYNLKQPPSLDLIHDQTILENTSSLPFTLTLTDNNEQSLTITYDYSNKSLLSSDSFAFSGPQVTSDKNPLTVFATSVETTVNLIVTPVFEQFGSTSVTITATDPHGMQDTRTFTLNVSEVNDPPTITTIDNQTIFEDAQSAAIHFTVADIEGNRLQIEVFDDSADLFPSNAKNITLSNESGGNTWFLITDKDLDLLTLLLRPALNQSGLSNLTVTVSDGENNVHTNFTMTVLPQNDQPTFSNIDNQIIDEDTLSQAIPFTVFDPDATHLSITVDSGNLRLIPSDTQHITLSNALGNKTYTLTTDTGNVPITLYVMPEKNLSGASVITITASDGTLSSSFAFTVTVLPVNDPPIISEIADQTTVEETSITGIGFTVNDIDTNILSIQIISDSPDVIPSDPAHITLSNSLGETGYTLLVNPLENISMAIKPATNAAGSAKIWVRVTGGTTDATTSFTITVIPINDAPILTEIDDQYALEDTRTIIPFVVTDPDTDPLTLTINTGNDLLIPSDARHITFQTSRGDSSYSLLTIPGGEAISLTILPLLNQSGQTSITITADDGIAQKSTTFIMTITGVNDAPTLTMIENQTVLEDTACHPIGFTVSDADADALTIEVVSINTELFPSETNHITLSNNTGEHSYTLTTHAGDELELILLPSVNLFGSAIISITVTDGTCQSSQFFTMTVLAVNDAPIISSIANMSIPEDTVSPNILFSIADPESDQLTIEIQSNNENLLATHTRHITLQGATGGTSYSIASNPGPLTLALCPNHNQTGTVEISIHATDGVGHSSSSFTMTVTEVNDLPEISWIPNQALIEDTHSAAISFCITDVDASQLHIYIQSRNENLLPMDPKHITICNASGGKTYTLLTNNKSEQLTLTVLPASNQTGDVSITVQVSDEYNMVSQSFTLSISPVNDPPVIVPVADHWANEDADIQIPFTAFDFEDPACSLDITMISSNQTLLANDHMTYTCLANMYTIAANPSLNQNGIVEIKIVAKDQAGESTTSTFGLNLIPINDPPTIHAPTQVRVKMNYLTPISDIYIEDCDAQNNMLAITLVTDEGDIILPSNQSAVISLTATLADINAQLSTIAYSPMFNATGSRAITITVDDMGHSGEGTNQITSIKISLQIHDNNVKPVNYLPDLTMNEDEQIHLTPISVFDLDAADNAIEVTLSTNHAYLTFGETASITLISGNFRSTTQIAISGSQYDINRALEHLTLTCTTDFNGWAALTMTTHDLGYTGEDDLPQTAINCVPITVLAKIDPPSHLLPETITLNEDIPAAVTACIIDPDGEDIIFIDLEVTTGELQLNSGKGLKGYLGTGNYLSFSGKKSDVNYAMQGMIFQPAANVWGNYTLIMTYKDMDYSAKSVSIPISICAVNDPPNIFVNPSEITIDEDTPLTLSISVFDIEAGTNDIHVFLNSNHCLLKINQTSELTVSPSSIAQSLTLTGSIDSLITALDAINVTPTNNYYGNTFITIKVDDQGFTPLPAESIQKTISITIMPVNDPPDFMLAPETITVFEDFSSPQRITFTTHHTIFGEPSQLTYTLTPEPASITWANITFVPASGMITITAIANRNGAAAFVLTADDGADENNLSSCHFSLSIVAVNDPPEFILSKNQIIVNEDFSTIESISLTPGVIPEDEPKTITYALQPASLTWVNLSIDSETGQISMTNIPHGHGEQMITIIADDGAITSTKTFSLSVNSINDLPQIISGNHFSISENTAIGTKVHHVTAIDVDNQNLTYKIVSIVPAQSFAISQNTGEIWISDNLDHETFNTYTMTVSVSDQFTTVNQTIIAAITDNNDAPILSNMPEQTLTTFQDKAFVIQGMNVSDIDAGSSPLQLTLIATNGVVSITHTSLTLESGNYSATSLSVSGTITSINQALTSVWFNPTLNYHGPANLFIEIDDLGHTGPGNAQSDAVSLSIFILNFNQPPIFINYQSDLICYEDHALTQTIVIKDEDAIDEAIQLTIISEYGSLTLAGMTHLNSVYHSKNLQSYTGNLQEINEALNGLIFHPENEFSGTAGYTLYANDLGHTGIGGPKSATPAVITISYLAVNDPPIHSLPDQITGLEESDIPLTITVSDIDAYTHAIHVQLIAYQGMLSLSHMEDLTISNYSGMAETSLSFTGTIAAINRSMHPIIFHPEANFYGHAGLTITTNDLGFSVPQGQAEDQTETDFFTITVTNVNDAPEFISTPLLFIDEDNVYAYTIHAGDVDGENVSLTVTRLPDWLTFTDYGNNMGRIQGIPKNEHVGTTAPLTIVATDPHQVVSIQSFSIVVNNTNDTPSFHSTPIVEATEDSLYRYTITAIDIDIDASLTFEANELPAWLQLKDHSDGTALLFGTPTNDYVGDFNVVILSVSDHISEAVKQAFLINVINTNDPPEIISSPVLTATEDALYNCTLTAYDMDFDTVSFMAIALPDWLTLNNLGESKAIIQGTPENQHVGISDTLVITAQDPFHATATQAFTITVINTNDMPAFSSEPLTVATEDSLYVYTVTVQDVDIDASISMQAPILSDWLTFVDYGDGTAILSGIPRNEHVGIKNAAVIQATDNIDNKYIEQKFMIRVENTNDPPNIISTAMLTATEDRLYSCTIIAEDMDGDLIDFSSDSLPQWLRLLNNQNNTATLMGIPQNEHVGISRQLTINAYDPDHLGASQSFSITVYNTNDIPVFVSQPKTTATEDSLYNYTIAVQDVDMEAFIEIKAASLPHWLSFTDYGNGMARINGIPLNDDVHQDNIVVLTANDGIEMAESQTFVISVINTNDAPVIASAAVLTATEDAAYVYTIVAKDMDGDSLKFKSELPSWLLLIDQGNNTALLEGIPGNADVGLSFTITITTIDPSQTQASQYFRIEVINTNDAPVFSSKPIENAIEDSLYSDTVSVSDIDWDAEIRIGALSLPDWLHIVDNGNGTASITGTPLNEHVGADNPLVITATDGIASEITQTFSITVANTNDLPEITSAAVLTATEDVFYSYTVIGKDIDGDLLFFTAQMPSWLSLVNHGNNTAILRGIPTNDDVGISSPIILTTLDPDNATATQSFTISVINTNDAPAFKTDPSFSAIEDSAYTYTIRVQDIDNGAIIDIRASSVPNWLTLTDLENGAAILTGIPKNENVGDHQIVIIATDHIAAVISQAFTITVANTNDPPKMITSSLPSVDEDSLYDATLTGEDMDGDIIVFSTSGLPSWLTLVNHGNNSASLQGIPHNDDIGQTTFLITVTDPDGATATRFYSLIVNNTNDPPAFISTPKTEAIEDSIYHHIVKVQDIDPDSQVHFSTLLLPEWPGWLTMTDNFDGTAVITGTPLNEDVGDHPIAIIAFDGIAMPIIRTYTIHVANTNDPPEISSSAIKMADEDTPYQYQITGDDIDGDQLRFIATGLPSWLTLSDNQNNTAILKGVPTNINVGKTGTIMITAIDPNNSIASQSFQIQVNNTNDPPWFASQPNTFGIEDITYAHTIRVEDMDPDATLIILSKTLPAWLTLTDHGNGTGRLTGKPLNEHVGNNSVVIAVTDGVAPPISQAFTIGVKNTNDAPVITSNFKQFVYEDSLYTYELHAQDVDQDDQLQFEAHALPKWLSLKDNGDKSALLQGMPENQHVGETSLFTLTVIDQAGQSDSQSFTIQVINTNDCPYISPIQSLTSLEYETTLPFVFSVTDMDGDALSIQASSSDASIVAIDASHMTFCAHHFNGESIHLAASNDIQPISLIILPVRDGVAGITITVDDGELSSSSSFMLTVTNVNMPPQIGHIPDTIIDEDAQSFPIGFTVADADCDGREVTVTVTTDAPKLLPTQTENISIGEMGLIHHFNADTPVDLNLWVSPVHNQSGIVGITVTIIDADGDSAMRHMKLSVNRLSEDPPELSLIDDINVLEDTPTYQTYFTVMDPDGGNLTIAVQSLNDQIVPPEKLICHQSNLFTTAHVPENLTVTINPMVDENGSVTIVIIAIDTENHVSERTFLLSVTPVNDTPLIADISPLIIDEDTVADPISFTLVDVDGDRLHINAISNNEQLITASDIQFQDSVDTNAGIPEIVNVRIVPRENAYGSAQISFIVTDPSGAKDTTILDLTVSPINDPPYISSIGHQYIYEDRLSSPIDLTISDVESGQLLLNAKTNNTIALPTSCLTFAGNANAEYTLDVLSGEPNKLTLIILPPKDINGTVMMQLTVYDSGGLYRSTQFSLTILPVNDMPKFNLKDISLDINEDAGYQLIHNWISNISSGANNETDSLAFVISTQNNHLFAKEPQIRIYGTTGTLSFTPSKDCYGTALVGVSLTDGYSSTTEKTFMINIHSMNDAPKLTTSITALKTFENQAFERIPFTITDVDDERFTISITTEDQFFSDISICSGMDCQHCYETPCEIQYVQTSKQETIVALIETLKQLSGITKADIYDIDTNSQMKLADAIYYINEASASFFLTARPQIWQSGKQLLTLMINDAAGLDSSQSISFSVTPVSNPPILTVNNCKVLEDELISIPLGLELLDKDSEELLDVLISGVPAEASLNKGIKNAGTWILAPEDIYHLLMAPPANCSDDISLTVTASSKEKTLAKKISVMKDVFIDIVPVADTPIMELESSEVSGKVNQEIPIVLKSLQLTDTDGSERWDRIEIFKFDSDLQFSKGILINGKLIIDLSDETEMDLSGWTVSVQSSNDATYSFLMRAISKEKENNDLAICEEQMRLCVSKKKETTDESGGCFIQVLGQGTF
jgi:sugar lactone lactonase YvrE